MAETKNGKTKAKGKAVKATNGEKKTRKAGKSFKDVQVALFLEGVAGVQSLYDQGILKASTARRAYNKLLESNAGEHATVLANWIVATFGSLSRGRSAPKAGEIRSYKVQGFHQRTPIKDEAGNVVGKKISETESLFMRLALDSLAVEKGQKIYVAFGETDIHVSTYPPVEGEVIDEDDDSDEGEAVDSEALVAEEATQASAAA